MSKYETFWVYDTEKLFHVFEYEREHFAKKRVKALNEEFGEGKYAYARGDVYFKMEKVEKLLLKNNTF